MKFGISGDRGSFSDQAAMLYLKNHNLNADLEYLIDMEGVLKAIAEGRVEKGILAVVNLNGGLVRMAFDAMGRHRFKVIDDLWLNINQCLLTIADTPSENIEKIVSHEQAFKQCQLYIKKNFSEAELIEFPDTAKAARELADGKLSATTAVIAPERAAQVYQLEILARNIQDQHPNLTGFIIVEKY